MVGRHVCRPIASNARSVTSKSPAPAMLNSLTVMVWTALPWLGLTTTTPWTVRLPESKPQQSAAHTITVMP